MTFRSRARGRGSGGQALAELAIILPVLIGLGVGGIDIARAYQTRIVLQSATRNAAEYAALYGESQSTALASARSVVCLETTALPGYAPGGTPSTCTAPTVEALTFVLDYTAPGATATTPVATATIRTTIPFETVVPYPFLDTDSWTVSVTETFVVIQQ